MAATGMTCGYLAVVMLLATVLQGSLAIQCYRCVTHTSKCPADQGMVECNRMDEKCVRLEQTLFGEEQGKKLYTMDCVGDMARAHTDLPRNRSVGCRAGEPQPYTLIGPAAALNPSSDEQNTYCFCDSADDCNNSGMALRSSSLSMLSSSLSSFAVAMATVVLASYT